MEICSSEGIECNTSNLIINHNWRGLLVDGDEKLIAKGREFYRTNLHTYVYPPVLASAWITRDNVNDIITMNGFSGEIDLFSLDMDGVDYWIWEAITAISPRVVVLEYLDILGPDRSWTVPYADDFSGYRVSATNNHPNFAGASLAAFVKLARRKGYRLVAINAIGYNAFFIREDLAKDILPTLDVKDCFSTPRSSKACATASRWSRTCPGWKFKRQDLTRR